MIIVYFLIYISIVLLIGFFVIYWSYRLFIEGLFTDKGEFYNKFGEKYIFLKKSIPAFLFFLFGITLVAISLFNGFKLLKYACSCCCCML